jgi:hypothetical protein
VIGLLVAGIVDREEAVIARQWQGEHAPAAADTHATIEELLKRVFSVLSVTRLHIEDQRGVVSLSFGPLCIDCQSDSGSRETVKYDHESSWTRNQE